MPADPNYTFTPHYTGGLRESGNPNISLPPPFGYLGAGTPGVNYDNTIIGGNWSPWPVTRAGDTAGGTAPVPTAGGSVDAGVNTGINPAWDGLLAWALGSRPGGQITGFGTTAPSGVYGPGGGPTAVPTFWGPSNDNGYGNLANNGGDSTSGGTGSGGGSGGSDNRSFLARLLDHTAPGFLYNVVTGNYDRIPAVRAWQSIQHLFNPQSPSSQTGTGGHGDTGTGNGDFVSALMQGPPAIPPGGALFGYNPASGGGGGTLRYNYGTGATASTPSTNPLYTTGGAWQPVANAPQDVRFSQNSGTGNFTADQTTKAFELSGGYPGGPNRVPGTSDRGKDTFQISSIMPGMTYNEETGFTPMVVDNSPAAIAHQTASRDLYQQALKAVPMGTDGYTLGYVQKLNDWIRAHQTADIFNPRTPPGTISGPPALQPFGSSNPPLIGGG